MLSEGASEGLNRLSTLLVSVFYGNCSASCITRRMELTDIAISSSVDNRGTLATEFDGLNITGWEESGRVKEVRAFFLLVYASRAESKADDKRFLLS